MPSVASTYEIFIEARKSSVGGLLTPGAVSIPCPTTDPYRNYPSGTVTVATAAPAATITVSS